MRETPIWRRYLRFFGPDVAADVDDELGFHLEMRAAELAARGFAPGEARAEAERRFGDWGRVREECRRLESTRLRRMNRLRFLDEIRRDVAFAVRTLARQPVFTLAAVLTLALGIGVNTAIFSAVNAFLFRPLPVRDPQQLAVIAGVTGDDGVPGNVNWLNFRDIQDRKDLFDDAVAWLSTTVNFRGPEDAEGERVSLSPTSGNFFAMLGVGAQAGRVYSEQDATERAPVALMSDLFWERRFKRDPRVLGQTVHFNGIPFRLIGVTPRGFHGTQSIIDPELYTPLTLLPTLEPGTGAMFERRDRGSVRILARLKQGVTVAHARTELAALAGEMARLYPAENKDLRLLIMPEIRSRPDIAVAQVMPWVASVFLGLVGLALVVACANVANLLLARASARAGEIAVRRALGATPARLLRQLLTESVILSIAALLVGLLLARWSVSWLNSLRVAVDAPIRFGVEIDWRVFTYATVAALSAGIASGLAPAFRGARLPLSENLKEGGRGGSASHQRTRSRNLLVVSQVAISLVLLVCAALFTRSVDAAARVNVGFRTDSTFMLSVDVGIQRYSEARGRQFEDVLVERAAAIQGVTGAALAHDVPFGGNVSTVDLFIDERSKGLEDGHVNVAWNTVSPDYFRVMGYRLQQGREFLRQDRDSAPPVVVVNEALARKLWPGREALGRQVRILTDGAPATVVGVVGNGGFLFLNEASMPMVFVPLAQHYRSVVTLHLATARPVAMLAPALRSIIHDFDAELVPYDLRTMQEHLQNGLALFFLRIAATLALAIGILGLLQTVVGLYGVLSYTVSQRTREIGIRMALGARARDVTGAIVRQGSVLVAIGLAIGLALALIVTRFLGRLLVGVSPTDSVAFVGSSLVLLLLALVSCYLPARRASRMEPVTALRTEG